MNFGMLVAIASLGNCLGADILMLTMGGTKSHKIPFLELAKGLMPRYGHIACCTSSMQCAYATDWSLETLFTNR